MPLVPGASRSAISANIHELTHHGSRPRSHAQIVAIALSNADRHPHKAAGGGIGIPKEPAVHLLHGIGSPAKDPHPAQVMGGSQATPWWTRSAAREMGHGFAEGGGIGHYADGGMSMSQDSPWYERQEARQFDTPHGGGLIASSLAGRTDRLPLSVASESHVLTGDVVSGLGQGNTLAGARILNQALRIGPYGTALPQAIHGHGVPMPHAPNLPHSETGLAAGGTSHKVSILAAGGEYIIPAHDWVSKDDQDGRLYLHRGVQSIGGGDIKKGHDLLDKMMENVRNHTIKFLKNAPSPKR